MAADVRRTLGLWIPAFPLVTMRCTLDKGVVTGVSDTMASDDGFTTHSTWTRVSVCETKISCDRTENLLVQDMEGIGETTGITGALVGRCGTVCVIVQLLQH